MFKIPELLAPAGGMEQLKAAVENGADAVYMGGKLFNARINAANFDDTEMKEAIEYTHLRGVKLYVTMNMLIKDRELSDALKYAASLYEEGADALIIQDLGFAELVRQHIPGWDLHLSTQGTIYNAEGVRKAKKLGFSRVVLARELTLKEIKEITDAFLPQACLEGQNGQNIRKNFDKIMAESAKNGIAVGNIGWIEPFVEAGVNVFGDYGLNLYNSMDFLLAEKLGIKEAVISHEADLADILQMNFHGVIPEVVLQGKIPVMTSERCLVGDLDLCSCKEEPSDIFLKDRKGQFYPVLTNPEDFRSIVLSHKETNLLNNKKDLKKAGIYRFRIYAV